MAEHFGKSCDRNDRIDSRHRGFLRETPSALGASEKMKITVSNVRDFPELAEKLPRAGDRKSGE